MASAEEGGGRIVGEVCHFVDLCSYIAGSPVVKVLAARPSTEADEVMATLRMANGSIATMAYLAGGDPAAPKERIEVHGGGATGTIEDFRTAMVSVDGRRKKRGWRFATRHKGHAAEVKAFVNAVTTGVQSPVASDSVVNTTRRRSPSSSRSGLSTVTIDKSICRAESCYASE